MDTSSVIAVMPELKAVEADLNVVKTMCEYADAKTPLPDAIQEVRIMSKLTPELIKASCSAVIDVISEVFEREMNTFNQEADANVKEISLVPFKARFDEEVAEQTKYRDIATRVMEMASSLALALNIPVPAAPVINTATNAPKKSLWVKMGIVVDEKEAPTVNNIYNWLTEPVLQESDDLVQKTVLLDNKYEESTKSADAVRKFATKFNMSDSDIAELILDVVAEARKQVAQSDQIIANVTNEYSQIERLMTALLSVKTDTNKANNYISGK